MGWRELWGTYVFEPHSLFYFRIDRSFKTFENSSFSAVEPGIFSNDCYSKLRGNCFLFTSVLVPREGIEPSRACAHQFLRLDCLPFQHLGNLSILATELAFYQKFRHSRPHMEVLRSFAQSLFQVDSIWSVVLRGVVWFAIALVIIVSTDAANPEKSGKNLKANLGFLLLFLVLSTGLIYLLFGFSGTPRPS